MTTFYLLPPRKELARRFAGYIQMWFPGVEPTAADLPDLLAATAEQTRDVVVVFGDDLPDDVGVELEPTLVDEFGALPCDKVFDLREGPLAKTNSSASWIIHGRSRIPLRKVS